MNYAKMIPIAIPLSGIGNRADDKARSAVSACLGIFPDKGIAIGIIFA